MERQSFRIVLSLVVVGALVAGCGKPNTESPRPSTEAVAQLSGEVEIMIPCGIMGPYGAIEEIFEKRYPDVEIKLDFANIDVQTKKVLNGKATPDVLVSLGDREIEAIAEKGLLEG